MSYCVDVFCVFAFGLFALRVVCLFICHETNYSVPSCEGGALSFVLVGTQQML